MDVKYIHVKTQYVEFWYNRIRNTKYGNPKYKCFIKNGGKCFQKDVVTCEPITNYIEEYMFHVKHCGGK